MRALLVLLVILVVASAADAKPLPNACTLVGDAKLTGALGPKVEHDAPPVTNGAKMCVWKTPSSAPSYREVSLQVQPLAKDVFTKKWNRKIAGVRPVRGVGELAYAVNGGEWLVAWSRGIEVTVNTTELKAPLQTATLVARLALAHL